MENVSETSIRVAVVDDHIMVSELLALSIVKEDDLTLVGVVDNMDDALRLLEREHPDVILLNYRCPDFDCIEVVKLMIKESPGSHVVMLSGNGDHDLQRLAIDAGCTGLLGKNARIGDVISAVRAAVRGELVITPGESLQLHSA